MAITKLFKNGNSQAARIPTELAYGNWDIDLDTERIVDELRIRPARKRMGDVLGKLARFFIRFHERRSRHQHRRATRGLMKPKCMLDKLIAAHALSHPGHAIAAK